MATIKISASDIQEHIDNCLNITSVSWNEYNGPEVEIEVKNDMEYEDDEFVDVAELNEIKEEYEELQKEFDALMLKQEEFEQDHTSLLTMYNEQVNKYDTLEADHNRLKQTISKKKSWLFWK